MLSTKKVFYILIAVIPAILFSVGPAHALDDQFISENKIEGKHTVVYCAPGLDTAALSRQLNIGPSDMMLIGKTIKSAPTPDIRLADMLDALFAQVSDITDMHIYSLQINVKVCRDYGELSGIYYNLFNNDLGNRRSFYVAESNTIYISSDSFKREILGHEMAHAIISRYFVISPPVKIQEVLAMYVEYCLRKGKP